MRMVRADARKISSTGSHSNIGRTSEMLRAKNASPQKNTNKVRLGRPQGIDTRSGRRRAAPAPSARCVGPCRVSSLPSLRVCRERAFGYLPELVSKSRFSAAKPCTAMPAATRRLANSAVCCASGRASRSRWRSRRRVAPPSRSRQPPLRPRHGPHRWRAQLGRLPSSRPGVRSVPFRRCAGSITRSQTASTSCMMWVERITVAFCAKRRMRFAHVLRLRWVQAVRRLVQDQQLRFVDDGLGHSYALLIATRKGADGVECPARQISGVSTSRSARARSGVPRSPAT